MIGGTRGTEWLIKGLQMDRKAEDVNTSDAELSMFCKCWDKSAFLYVQSAVDVLQVLE